MKEKLVKLEQDIALLASQPGFIHHKWFVAHHLKIVEQLALELCGLYPRADRNVVMAMVWLHDLGKILTNKQVSHEEETRVTLAESRKKLEELGFAPDFVKRVLNNLDIFEQATSRDLAKENIEVQIASSADGCSHYIRPFMAIYWYENPDKSVDELIDSNKRKIKKDWDHKITLPEARAVFESRIMSLWRESNVSERQKLRFFTAAS